MIHRGGRDTALDGDDMQSLFTRAQPAEVALPEVALPDVAVPEAVAPPIPAAAVESPDDALLSAQQHLTTTRTRWSAALKAANSGRSADMAELALAQADFDEARAAVERREEEAAEYQRRVEEMRLRRQGVEARAFMIAAQSEGWRAAAEQANAPKRRGLLGRVLRR